MATVEDQIRALTEIVGMLAEGLSRLSARVEAVSPSAPAGDDEPAAWAVSSPQPCDDPNSTVEGFVAFYNTTYVGSGGKAGPIPACWRDHPGLAMEVATLAHSWRAANLGRAAAVRDAQQWHHLWRPGFADRLARDWLNTDCLDGLHHGNESRVLAMEEPTAAESTNRRGN